MLRLVLALVALALPAAAVVCNDGITTCAGNAQCCADTVGSQTVYRCCASAETPDISVDDGSLYFTVPPAKTICLVAKGGASVCLQDIATLAAVSSIVMVSLGRQSIEDGHREICSSAEHFWSRHWAAVGSIVFVYGPNRAAGARAAVAAATAHIVCREL